MKKTYVTTMPNRIGAFLKASECFAALGLNITRVSYNKAVDSHTLFIDAVGTEEQHAEAEKQLSAIGYLQNDGGNTHIVLLEFYLKDVPGSITGVLSLINEFHFNISYISSQGDGSDHQAFKVGLFVDDSEKVDLFMQQVQTLCRVRVIDYNHAEKVYDNSIFYRSFVSGISHTMSLDEKTKERLLVNANLAMQNLDERGLSPHKTFDSISRFAEMLAAARGEGFLPRVTRRRLTDRTEALLIEPPCGSNTTVLFSDDEVLFIDCGYTLYEEEMRALLRREIPDYDNKAKTLLLTHGDFDHSGLAFLFDRVYATKHTAEDLRLEYEGEESFREKNPLHLPYINICKILTQYAPVCPEKVIAPWGRPDGVDEPLVQVGFFDFGDLHFEVYEGAGGHTVGELVLIDYAHRVAFTGDIYVNLKGMTPTQAEYNRYAPILMTSVDTDPALCAKERNAILQRLGGGKWQIYSGHGAVKDYSVCVEG